MAYPFPHDELEHDRLDLFHHMIYRVALQGNLYLSQLYVPTGPVRVLDIGHGTSFWLLDMCDDFGRKGIECMLRGIDLCPCCDARPRPESDLELRAPVDFENDDWGFNGQQFDLIHVAQLCGSVSDWRALFDRVRRHLVPGTGRLEWIEMDWEPRCDDGSLQPNSPINTWWRFMCEATRTTGRPIEYPSQAGELLDSLGLMVEKDQRIMVRTWEEMQATDKYHNSIARCFRTAMGSHSAGDECRSYSGMAMALFTQVLQPRWGPEHVERMQDDIYPLVNSRAVHMYSRL